MPIPGFPQLQDSDIFPIVNVTFTAHLLLVIAPRHKLVQAYVALLTGVYALLYVLLLGNILFVNPDPNWTFSQMGTYEGVAQLFKVQATVLPAWVHYIAFDLWVSRWIALDAASRGFPKLLLAPCVFLTIMAGPTGWLLYMLLRGNWRVKSKTA